MSVEIPPGFLLETGTDPAEDLCGPFYLHRDGENVTAGMLVEARHCNGMHSIHGGILMTFADFALCAQARYLTTDQHIVTVSLKTDFVDGADVGSWLHSDGEVIKRTGSLVFVQGMIRHGDRAICSYSGVGKRKRGD